MFVCEIPPGYRRWTSGTPSCISWAAWWRASTGSPRTGRERSASAAWWQPWTRLETKGIKKSFSAENCLFFQLKVHLSDCNSHLPPILVPSYPSICQLDGNQLLGWVESFKELEYLQNLHSINLLRIRTWGRSSVFRCWFQHQGRQEERACVEENWRECGLGQGNLQSFAALTLDGNPPQQHKGQAFLNS